MTLPIYDNGVASGLLSGILFGYVLENAGFASPRKLTAQFRFSDWSVFKVMFTAIIVAAIGLYAAMEFGLMRPNGIFIPTTFFWASSDRRRAGRRRHGGRRLLPGHLDRRAVDRAGSMRLFFIVGMVLGTGLFAGVFDPIKVFYLAGEGPQAQTLGALFGIPTWAVLAILIVIAIIGFALGTRFERAYGGPLTAEQLNGGEERETIERIDIVSVRTG